MFLVATVTHGGDMDTFAQIVTLGANHAIEAHERHSKKRALQS